MQLHIRFRIGLSSLLPYLTLPCLTLSYPALYLPVHASQVLERGGALPGGEARAYLFYEATKNRRVIHDQKRISWREAHEAPGGHEQPLSPKPPSSERHMERHGDRVDSTRRNRDDHEAALRRKAKAGQAAGGERPRPESARPSTQAFRPRTAPIYWKGE